METKTSGQWFHVIFNYKTYTVESLTQAYNDREKQRNANLIIGMSGNTTSIKNPENMSGDPRKFAFDFSYWSHDEFKDRGDGYLEPTSSKYADQVNKIHVIVCWMAKLLPVYANYIGLSVTWPMQIKLDLWKVPYMWW